MLSDRLFLDSAYVVALLNPRDSLHGKALRYFAEVKNAREIWTTEAVLLEIGNTFSDSRRTEAGDFIEQSYATANMIIVPFSTTLLQQALSLYRQRLDKDWGLTDCVSFVVMQEQNLIDALTFDLHFQQAGFRVLLREDLVV